MSYWICSCGKSNLNSSKRCAACQKRKPLSLWVYASIALAGLLVASLALPSSEQGKAARANIPQSQEEFLETVMAARREIAGSANSLAASEALSSRDIELSQHTDVTEWRGTVTGIQSMQGKGAIGIDIGGVELVAGQHVLLGLDTLIPPTQRDLYGQLISIERGQEVILSGNFVVHEGALVELSYTGSGSATSPRFLFGFSKISQVSR